MPYAGGEWTEYPQPPPEQYSGPWPPEQYPAYLEQYANAAVSAVRSLCTEIAVSLPQLNMLVILF